jgi:plasmid stabilization system protein ParE
MTEPRLTDQAESDLDDLWAYIAANNPKAADRIVDAVLQGRRTALIAPFFP